MLPLPGRGGWRERAREYGKRIYAREDGCEGARGSPSLWSHRSPVCKEWCVCVCECARVRACVAVGGGVPGVLQHQTEPRSEGENPDDGTTADPTLNPSPAGLRRAASSRSLPQALRSPPPPACGPRFPRWGLGPPLAPALSPAAAERRSGSAARPTGRRLVLPGVERSASPQEAGSVAGISVM